MATNDESTSAEWSCWRCGSQERYSYGGCKPCRRTATSERKKKDKSKLLCFRCKSRPRQDGKHCSECLNKIANNVPVVARRKSEYVKDWALKKRYGISLEEVNAMMLSQNYLCAICNDPERSGDNVYWLGVDHDHETGNVRRMLCRKCNAGIGIFNDSIDLLSDAIEYLKSFKESL